VLALILVPSLNAIFFSMKHITILVTLFLIHPLLVCGQTFTDSLGGGLEAHEKIPFKTVSGEVTELYLHLFYPPDYNAKNTYPAIVLFFGGGWNGWSASHFFTHASYLSSRGMVVICPDYRTKQSHGCCKEAGNRS
jgi:acetyl esterase/lipase